MKTTKHAWITIAAIQLINESVTKARQKVIPILSKIKPVMKVLI